MRARTIISLFGVLALCAGVAGAQDVLINEVDADTDGTDVLEFIELYGVPNTPLDGMAVVLINGSDDLCYADGIDLDGYTLNANGFFLIGCAGVVPTPDIVFAAADNVIQNGADAVALYYGDGVDWANDSTWTTDNLIDAIVYDTNDADDAGLLVLLNAGEPQLNEDGAGNKDFDSNQRCPDGAGGARNTSAHIQAVATPGGPNNCQGPPTYACCFPDGSCQDLTEEDCIAAGGVAYLENACDDIGFECPQPQPTDMALCDAVALDADGIPVNIGLLVHITSPLLVLNDDGTYSSDIVDAGATDGECCVNIFDFNATDVLMEGDLVDVVGTVANYAGKAEITDLTLTLISSGNALPDPEAITTEELSINGEDYESCLISICGLEMDPGQWPAEGSNTNIDVWDDTGVVIVLRIDKETDVDGSTEPATPFTCIGLGGQFVYSPPHIGGFQILPRSTADVLSGVDCPTPANEASWGELKNMFK